MKPGIYQISNNEYHSSNGVSRSALVELRSPLRYWDKHINPDKEPKEITDDMIIGNLVHTLALEPDLFESEYIIQDKVDGRTSAGKEYLANFQMQAIGKQIITREKHLELATSITEAIKTHPRFGLFTENAHIEKSIYWTDDETGFLCKARPDIWNDELNTIIDIKTTSADSSEKFIWSITDYGYHMQAAMQIDAVFQATGKSITNFVFMVAPKKRPHKPFIYWMTDEAIGRGRSDYKYALKILKSCMDNNRWDLDRDKTIPITLNNYQLNNSPFQKLAEIYV